MSTPLDDRPATYQNLHTRQLLQQNQQNHHAATVILSLLRRYHPFTSVLDVGCGLGTWLKAASELGATDIQGVEGPWLDPATAVINPNLIQQLDLEQPFSLARRYDLAICLEVGEHLAPAAAPHLIHSLTAHADIILFSAAIPFQGGHHHVNEQFLPYWIDLFAAHQFAPIDLFRATLWHDPAILWWLRQNIILFASPAALAANPALREQSQILRPLSIVHPDIYLSRLLENQQLTATAQQLLAHLQQGGHFNVQPLPDGRLNIIRLNPERDTK